MTPTRRPAPVLVALVALVVGLALGTGPAVADDVPPADPVVATTLPTVDGTPRYDAVLTATPGTWDPADVTTSYRWLRDGVAIAGATAATYRLAANDVGHPVSVRVTATTADGRTGTAESASTAPVAAKPVSVLKRSAVEGTRRFGRTLTARPATWSVTGMSHAYRWLRDGAPIANATRRTYVVAPNDVGRRLSVRVTGTRAGHATATSTSARTGVIGHRRDVKRTITYRVTRNGSKASLATFRSLAAATLKDPRGWRGGGIAFKEVSKGGSFTLVLAKASRVPGYSSGCSAQWSCRVGRNVIINETRWDKASPAWNAADGSLRDYRHMVVNHEVGHFLGKGHRSCGGKGRLAPVMQQQSKGLGGCRFNPWPLVGELSGL